MTAAAKLLFFICAVLGLASSLHAQTPATRSRTSPGVVEITGSEKAKSAEQQAVERADADAKSLEDTQITDPTVFVKSAALGGLTEVELAKVAQSQSQDAGVRDLAA